MLTELETEIITSNLLKLNNIVHSLECWFYKAGKWTPQAFVAE